MSEGRKGASWRSGPAMMVAAAVAVVLSACSTRMTDYPHEVTEGVTLIDVRTPQEFAEGHLDGAVNIPVESPSFAAQVDALPRDGEFLVYCRSGRRAELAIEYLESRGMSAVNLGSLPAAAEATGLAVVR